MRRTAYASTWNKNLSFLCIKEEIRNKSYKILSRPVPINWETSLKVVRNPQNRVNSFVRRLVAAWRRNTYNVLWEKWQSYCRAVCVSLRRSVPQPPSAAEQPGRQADGLRTLSLVSHKSLILLCFLAHSNVDLDSRRDSARAEDLWKRT